MRTHSRIIAAHHLILVLYGHWPPNDPRGSGSRDFYDDKFAPLGPIHHGRKSAPLQPSRAEMRAYHKQVEPLLNFPVIWLDDATRQVVAEAFEKVMRDERYTCWACAILRNHVHMVIRRHRDTYQIMFSKFANAMAAALRSCEHLRLADNHPVVSQRPYSAYCYTPEDIAMRIKYVQDNPEKEGLPPQRFLFVQPYDGWPGRRR